MIISAHQPAYNPWLGYFHKILISDIFVIMDDVQFEKGSFINRNKIYQKPAGMMLTIPCSTKDYKNKAIKSINVSNLIWKEKHLKSIYQTYSKAPYFDIVYSMVEEAINFDGNLLINYTNALFFKIIDYLKIKTQIILASDMNLTGKKLGYVVELTRQLNGKTFVFGVQGKDYADIDILKQANIRAVFQDYQHPVYPQKSEPFIPFLGILDLLFNVAADNVINIILSNNVTKKDIYDR